MGEEEDPYSQVARGKLTLKKDAAIKKKKKKKDKKILEQITKTIQSAEDKKEETKQGSSKTNAEIAFQKMQEKMVSDRTECVFCRFPLNRLVVLM